MSFRYNLFMNIAQYFNDSTWLQHLSPEFKKDYFVKLNQFLDSERELGKAIYPKKETIFKAFNLTPIEKVKVVIIGQDPYHGEGQAHGLAFSVPKDIKLPPSLKNIFKELADDLKIEQPKEGDLSRWAKQGVLLLNTVLTVEASKAGSHQNKGWEKFTDQVIRIINEHNENVVFVLWGKPAQKKMEMINQDKHKVLVAPHPSPLSSYRGFFGSKPFSLINDYLKEKNRETIDWLIS